MATAVGEVVKFQTVPRQVHVPFRVAFPPHMVDHLCQVRRLQDDKEHLTLQPEG